MSNISITEKLWFLFTPEQRYKAFILLILMFMGMLLETLGIGLVIPLLILISKDDLIYDYPDLAVLLGWLGDPTQQELIVFVMTAFVIVYAIKVIFLCFSNWWQFSFIAKLQASYSQVLFSDYLRRPYSFHLQYNSAELIHNITSEVSAFIRSAQSLLVIISEGLVFLGVAILLVSVEPYGALFVLFVLGSAGWLIHKCTKGFILKLGRERQIHDGMRLQHLQQGLGSAKDIKLMGREDEFINQFKLHNDGSARVNKSWATMMALPRLWLELLVVVSLAVLVLTMIGRNNEFNSVVPVLGVFAAAAFRIMPSVNRVLNAFQGMRFALPAINRLYGEFKNLDQFSNRNKKNRESVVIQESLKLDKEIQLNKVVFKYHNSHKVILSEINLNVFKGSTVGFIGTTGAGKSTLIDVVLGLLTPTSGEILIDGVNVEQNVRGWQDQIGYVPQSIYITDDSISRNVAFGLPDDEIDDELVWKALRAAHLDEFIQELPESIHTVLGEHGVFLSGGQRQRIGIARALYHEPDILVLDEATSSLDVVTENEIMQTVKDLHGNKTILIVAHRLSTIEACDWVYRLNKGKVSEQGTPSKLLYKDTTNS